MTVKRRIIKWIYVFNLLVSTILLANIICCPQVIREIMSLGEAIQLYAFFACFMDIFILVTIYVYLPDGQKDELWKLVNYELLFFLALFSFIIPLIEKRLFKKNIEFLLVINSKEFISLSLCIEVHLSLLYILHCYIKMMKKVQYEKHLLKAAHYDNNDSFILQDEEQEE